MKYWVTRGGLRWPENPEVFVVGLSARIWNLAKPFSRLENAIDAAKGYLREHPSIHVDVKGGDGTIHWCIRRPETPVTPGVTEPPTEGEEVHPDLENPLLIPRTDLVSRLQSNLDEETKARETVEAKERQARLAVTQFITDHEEEIVEWVGKTGVFGTGSWEDVAKAMGRFFEDHDYKPSRARKNQRENDLEKYVRVLSMATNETVEVKPNQQIYELL